MFCYQLLNKFQVVSLLIPFLKDYIQLIIYLKYYINIHNNIFIICREKN